MIGTKLFLLTYVVYASGQGLTYYGSSNVRTQGRLPPRPLSPYRPTYSPNAGPSPVYNPQPVYQPSQPLQPVQPSDLRPQPSPIRRPPTLSYGPTVLASPVFIDKPKSSPAPESTSAAPEIPPQPVYYPIPPQPAMPLQPAPRPINSYPRPLSPWSWQPIRTTEAPAAIIIGENSSPSRDAPTPSAPPSIGPKAVIPNFPNESTSLPVEELTVALAPTTETSPSPSAPKVSQPIEVNPKPEPVPEPSTPEPLPAAEIPIPPASLPPQPEKPVTEEPLSDPIPTSPLDNQPKPTASYPIPRPLPPLDSRPLSVPVPVTPEPQPLAPKPVPAQPTVQPETPAQPILPPAPIPPIASVSEIPNIPSYQPVQPPTPNYQPNLLPTTPQPLPATQPPAVQPGYYPMQPPVTGPLLEPSTPQPPIPGYPVPLPTPGTTEPTNDVLSIIPLNDFQCNRGNAYYTIINVCDEYIECQGQRAYRHTCPDGLYFNPRATYPSYPCTYPSEVQCESTSSKQTPRPTNECPNQYGFFALSGGDCSRYIMCQEGTATIMNCPYGLVFNERLSSCDWPENVPQCNLSVFKDFTCPTPPADDPDLLTKYRYGKACKTYVACQRGHPRLLTCDAGLSFDENSQVCIDSDLVTDCT